MFQYGQRSNVLFEVEHQHSDGSWGRLAPEENREHHDPAGHDPEGAVDHRRVRPMVVLARERPSAGTRAP